MRRSGTTTSKPDHSNNPGGSAAEGSPADSTAQAQLVAEFVADLRRMRQHAGQPSLREMSKTAHYSHTALSGALSGGRLPSLELTLALVRACGGDEDQWRERWRQVNGRVNPAAGSLPQPRRRCGVVLGTGFGLAVVLLVGLGVGLALRPKGADQPAPAGSSTAPGASGASVPLIPADASEFISDVTFPDGTPVRVNERFTKTWEIRNAGSVLWHDRYLTRQTPQDPNLCSSPPRVPIPLTPPGQTVQISVTLTAPSLPGSCRIDWKMTDTNGNVFFPNTKGLYLIVNVVP